MTVRECREQYERACAAKGYVPDDGQEKMWKRVLGDYEAADLEGAIDRWYKTEAALPMPAQLKPLIEAERLKRIAAATPRRDFVVWKCPDCGASKSGWPVDGGLQPRVCTNWVTGGICNGIMTEFFRERAA